jgi:cobalt/nickel transport system permease protein
MHIPDGYLSPQTYIPAYITAVPLMAYGIKKLKESLNEETFPFIATLTALSFLIMMINIPIPGGTSGHAIGTAVLAILFNPWIAFVSVSLVLLIQALIFGDGGMTAWAVNSLGIGFIASFSAYYSYKFLKNLNKNLALFLSGWLSIALASLFIAIILGVQPIIAHNENGNPLYFPFDLSITIPALVGSHMLYFGIIEGVFTFVVVKFIEKIKNHKLEGVKNEI